MASARKAATPGSTITPDALAAEFAAVCDRAELVDRARLRPRRGSALDVAAQVYGSKGDVGLFFVTIRGERTILLDWQIDDEAGVELFRADGSRLAWSTWSVDALREGDLRPQTIRWTIGERSDAFERHAREAT